MTAPEFTLLDGGMGRELQRRGLIEPAIIWSGSALIDHPQTVRLSDGDRRQATALGRMPAPCSKIVLFNSLTQA